MGSKTSIRNAVVLGCLLGHCAGWAAAPAATTPAAAGNPEAVAEAAAPVQVHFRDRILFEVAAPLGTLSPTDRARAVEGRLLALAAGPPRVLQTLHVEERDGLSALYAGDTLIRAISDEDAQPTGRTRRQLAADQLLIIRRALAVEYKDRGAAHIARGLGFSIGATALLLALLGALRWLYRWIHARINRAAQAWRWASGLARLNLFSPATVANMSRSIATALAFSVGLLLIYFYLEFVLSQFPWTRGLADRMVAAATRAVVHVFSGLFGYVPSLVNIVVIVFVARYILKAFRGLFEQIAAEKLAVSGFHPSWGLPTYSIVRFFVIAVAAVMVFPYLPGSGSAGFRGVSTFVGLAISFGGAPAIGNMIAGIIITYMRPFATGDRVKIADAVGDVIAKNLLLVRLRTIKNVEISIPNSLVLANHIINFSANAREQGLILHTTVTISYGVAWNKVHELLVSAARRVEGILLDPAPFVLQTKLDDFFVMYEINAYTNRPNDQAQLYSALHAAIQDSFNEAGVEIMSPHYTAVRDGNAMGLPHEYLPKDYQAPGFRLWPLRPHRP